MEARKVLDRLEALLAAATPGPWIVGKDDPDACGSDSCIHSVPDMSKPIVETLQLENDADAIVAIRNAAPALIRLARAAVAMCEPPTSIYALATTDMATRAAINALGEVRL